MHCYYFIFVLQKKPQSLSKSDRHGKGWRWGGGGSARKEEGRRLLQPVQRARERRGGKSSRRSTRGRTSIDAHMPPPRSHLARGGEGLLRWRRERSGKEKRDEEKREKRKEKENEMIVKMVE